MSRPIPGPMPETITIRSSSSIRHPSLRIDHRCDLRRERLDLVHQLVAAAAAEADAAVTYAELLHRMKGCGDLFSSSAAHVGPDVESGRADVEPRAVHADFDRRIPAIAPALRAQKVDRLFHAHLRDPLR